MLTDSFGRHHRYLRISVTDRCNFRCVYCMPQDGMSWMPKNDILSYEEITRLVGVFAKMGIESIRISGGEPTIRADITQLISSLSEIEGITDLSMTTNGHTLEKMSVELAEAGLNRINLSIDTLKKDRFKKLTRGGNLDRVLRGLDKALAAGIQPIKLNAVLLRGENEDEILDLVHFASEFNGKVQLRFIEYMPFESRWYQCVPAKEVQQIINVIHPMEAQTINTGLGPSRDFYLPTLGVTVGFISPLSQKFCSSCNRLRLMADGHLRTCLAHEDTPSLRDIIRNSDNDEQVSKQIRALVLGKPEGHGCDVKGGKNFEGIMTRIGG